MTRFGKFVERGLKSLAEEAASRALRDAGLTVADLEAAYMGNAAAAVMTGQVLIPGQVVLRSMGIGRIPVVNVENACATSATALHEAATLISAGVYDTVLVVGYEKLYCEDRSRTLAVFRGGVDVEALESVVDEPSGPEEHRESGGRGRHSLFMEVYARGARRHMDMYGTAPRHFAMIAAKNSMHGSLNPNAQLRDVLGVEDVLQAPVIVPPLTRPMCSPIGDGAAALVLVSERQARKMNLRPAVRLRASELATGWEGSGSVDESVTAYAANRTYEAAGVGPSDLDVIELHDATAPAELALYETLGLAAPGEGAKLIEDGTTRLGGALPVNTSGGLLRKGHPIGASGAAQAVELCEQLRGTAGARQVEGARLGLAENGGGAIGSDTAVVVVSIWERMERL